MQRLDISPVVCGNCVICGKKIEVAKWVSDIIKPTTCCRACGEAEAKM